MEEYKVWPFPLSTPYHSNFRESVDMIFTEKIDCFRKLSGLLSLLSLGCQKCSKRVCSANCAKFLFWSFAPVPSNGIGFDGLASVGSAGMRIACFISLLCDCEL